MGRLDQLIADLALRAGTPYQRTGDLGVVASAALLLARRLTPPRQREEPES